MVVFRQCVVLCLLGFFIDLLQTVHIQACAGKQLFLSVSTIIAIYMVGFWGHAWFNDAQDDSQRWWITVAGALGAGIGTGVVIWFGG